MQLKEERLRQFIESLSEDQKRLIRESVGADADVDPQQLTQHLASQGGLEALGRVIAPSADAGVPKTNAGTGNAGTGTTVRPEPPLTRW